MSCQHEQFDANVAVNRMEDTAKIIVDVRIHCVQCGEPFRFLGVRAGIAWTHPTCSIDETELHVPIEAEGNKRLQTTARFQMPDVPRKH